MKILTALWVSITLTACSALPKVATKVSVALPARSADSIAIYEQGDSLIPLSAQEIGTLTVGNGGMTPLTECGYSNLLALAVKQTAACGGNGLRIDQHKTPNVWTDHCHRIKGTMLLLPDDVVRQRTTTSLSQLEAKKDSELMSDMQLVQEQQKKMFDTPKDIVKANLGVSWISTKYYVNGRNRSWEPAFDFSIEYEHLWRWIGVGFNLEHATYSFGGSASSSSLCMGPDLILTMMTGQRLRWEVSIGLDANFYTEKYRGQSLTETRLCPRFSLGAEYRVARKWAVGVQYDVANYRQDAPKGVTLKDNEYYGFNRIGLFGGIRYYL